LFLIKYLEKTPDHEYYSKKVKRLKIKVRKAYNKRQLEEHHLEEQKRLFKQLLAAKKTAQETFFRSILSKEGKCWPEFYKYVKRRKGYTENIPGIKDCNGRLIKDPIQKTNSFNYYYSSVFSNEGNTQHIQRANSGLLFTIDTKIIRKTVRQIGKKQISRARCYFWRNFKTGWGSLDSIPCTITSYNNK